MGDYEYWDKISVLSAEIRDAIENDFSADTIQVLEKNFYQYIKNSGDNKYVGIL